MDALNMVITILQLLCGLAIIVIVLFQSGKSAGLSGAIGGVADSFLAKNKAKTLDAKLARATKWVGAVFLVLTFILLILLLVSYINPRSQCGRGFSFMLPYCQSDTARLAGPRYRSRPAVPSP